MNIYWMGGSVCSGKSSVAAQLASQWGAVVYDYDATERDHLERLGRSNRIIDRIEDHEARRRAHDERWLFRPPAEMATRTIRSWTERFPLVLQDLRALPGERILAQGAGLFPELVAPQLADGSRGAFLIATPEFIRWARRTRGMSAPAMTSNPDFAWENIIARDCLMASHVRDQATRLGLSTITTDGAEPIDKVTRRVVELFGWVSVCLTEQSCGSINNLATSQQERQEGLRAPESVPMDSMQSGIDHRADPSEPGSPNVVAPPPGPVCQ